MVYEYQIGATAYPEMGTEEEEESVINDDARPVLSQPFDWTISSLRDKYERGQIDLQPAYQRDYVWALKPELPSRLIESLLLQIPIPPIYFGKMPGQKFEVIDGQQRLTTLIRFVRNEFSLQRLQRLGTLNGVFFVICRRSIKRWYWMRLSVRSLSMLVPIIIYVMKFLNALIVALCH